MGVACSQLMCSKYDSIAFLFKHAYAMLKPQGWNLGAADILTEHLNP